MVEWMQSPLASDPARVHTEGHAARIAVEDARDAIAELLGARNREVVFTSGATEAIAAATWGAAPRGRTWSHPRSSTLRCAWPRPPTPRCRGSDVTGAAASIRTRSRTPSGPTRRSSTSSGATTRSARCSSSPRSRSSAASATCSLHVDAAQAAGHVPVYFDDLGVDLLSVSAHKMGGPPGVGALLVRRGLRLRPLLLGGDQERARRAGFENVPAIIGWGAAARSLIATLDAEERTARRLTRARHRACARAGRRDALR